MDTCVCCGATVPEGRQLCKMCSEITIQPSPSKIVVASSSYRIFINGRELDEVKSVEWFNEAIAEKIEREADVE